MSRLGLPKARQKFINSHYFHMHDLDARFAERIAPRDQNAAAIYAMLRERGELRLVEICTQCVTAWQAGRHDTSGTPATPEAHVAKMRAWTGQANDSWNLPLLLDLRDTWGFSLADEYEALLVSEALRRDG